MILGMTSARHLVVEIEVSDGDQEPIHGLARAPGLSPRSFSGWSELFAVLQTLVGGVGETGGPGNGPDPGRGTGTGSPSGLGREQQ
jgi:hypothetical protein